MQECCAGVPQLRSRTPPYPTIPELVRQLSVPIRSVSLRRPSLDDVFLALTGRQIRDEEPSSLDQLRERIRARR
ncbi:multidrug ABC transporter, ATP-binding protein [Thermomicrobium roseum DSM 5159]|uniref:Multidrug ABC transporter, ATP-binding protein n=1 Tax=Thermomicrobium roseum (strain ATCC 27502 / DSM 5159 / P-2) TaxID=309801 RepID=B9KYK3_THERP|nr:multidrug ABC transporter, ATP-binding protein [Thermomicrobium roseum DSM 5159]